MTRREVNLLILDELKKLCNKYPDIRFGQLLINCNLLENTCINGTLYAKDPYYEESIETLKKLLLSKFAFYEIYN